MKTFSELCPFRKNSASEKVYRALASSSKPMTVVEIAKRSKVPLGKTQTLVAAYFNKFHCAPLTRAGVEFVRDSDGGIKLGRCKPNPKAVRPQRCAGKKQKQSKPKKSGKVKTAARSGIVKQPVAMTETLPSAPDQNAGNK